MRDQAHDYQALGCEILGISFDGPAANKAFKEKHDFPFTLLSDVDQRVGEAYQAKPGPDAKYPGFAMRLSYLIDPDGVVARSYKVTDVAAHPGEVLADLRAARQG